MNKGIIATYVMVIFFVKAMWHLAVFTAKSTWTLIVALGYHVHLLFRAISKK